MDSLRGLCTQGKSLEYAGRCVLWQAQVTIGVVNWRSTHQSLMQAPNFCMHLLQSDVTDFAEDCVAYIKAARTKTTF